MTLSKNGLLTKARIELGDTIPIFDSKERNKLSVISARELGYTKGIVLADATVGNTTTKTKLFQHLIEAHKLHAGQVIFLSLLGHYSTANAIDTCAITAELNGTTLHTKTTVAESVTNAYWQILLALTIRSAGVAGSFVSSLAAVFNNTADNQIVTSTSVINTTADQRLKINAYRS